MPPDFNYPIEAENRLQEQSAEIYHYRQVLSDVKDTLCAVRDEHLGETRALLEIALLLCAVKL